METLQDVTTVTSENGLQLMVRKQCSMLLRRNTLLTQQGPPGKSVGSEGARDTRTPVGAAQQASHDIETVVFVLGGNEKQNPLRVSACFPLSLERPSEGGAVIRAGGTDPSASKSNREVQTKVCPADTQMSQGGLCVIS